jgi:hypothetical protein
VYPQIAGEKNILNNIIISIKAPIPYIYLQITGVNIKSLALTGGVLMILVWGFSVARARAARTSIIRLIQSS